LPSLEIATANSLASGGIGLYNENQGKLKINLPKSPAPAVRQVLAYWVYENDASAPEANPVFVNGKQMNGLNIGFEHSSSDNRSTHAVRADISSLVSLKPGLNELEISRLMAEGQEFFGAAVIVLYDDPEKVEGKVLLRDGLDLASVRNFDQQPRDELEAKPIVFDFTPTAHARSVAPTVVIAGSTWDGSLTPAKIMSSSLNFTVGSENLTYSFPFVAAEAPRFDVFGPDKQYQVVHPQVESATDEDEDKKDKKDK
jgi:hypothetical protein